MTVLRNVAWIAVLGAMFLGGCNSSGTDDNGPQSLFGNGLMDNSRVVARVDGEPITENMLQLRLNEMGPSERSRYEGNAGQRLLVHRMVEESLHVREAEDMQVQRDPLVAQVLIAQYRQAMDLAHRNTLVKDIEPSVDQVREYFESNRDKYVKLGTMQASHIETATRSQAQEAYEALTVTRRAFDSVCKEYSQNSQTILNSGNLGWFNRGGFVPGIRNSESFTTAIWDLEQGTHEPIQIDAVWHVVVVNSRQHGRMQTMDEAYERVVHDMMPELQQKAVRRWIVQAKAEATLEYFDEFRPGLGKTPKELLDRAFHLADPKDQANTLRLLIEDFPDDEYTDDALFMAANLHLDQWGEAREASIYLTALVKRFPDSEYAADSQYILDNMGKPGFTQPRSIEDLRRP